MLWYKKEQRIQNPAYKKKALEPNLASILLLRSFWISAEMPAKVGQTDLDVLGAGDKLLGKEQERVAEWLQVQTGIPMEETLRDLRVLAVKYI